MEKSLKAFLLYHDVEFPWIHHIGPLLDLCIDQDDSFAQLMTTAVPLTEYAVRFRYPFSGSPPSEEQVRGALATAREVFAFVTARLPAETHPDG